MIVDTPAGAADDERVSYNVSVNNFGLNIFHLNIRSIKNKLDELKILIRNLNSRPDVIIISETWLLPENCDFINLDGYTAVHNCRPVNYLVGNGGLSIFVCNNIDFDIIKNELYLQNHAILINLKKQNVKLGALYRDSTAGTIDGYLNYLDNLLETYHDFIFLGDMNVNVLRDNENTGNYVETLAGNGYEILNRINDDYYTFSGPHGISLLDHVFTDIRNRRFNVFIGEVAFSDHRSLQVAVSAAKQSQSGEIKVLKTDFAGFDASLRSEIAQSSGTVTNFDSFFLLFSTILRLFQSVRVVGKSRKNDMPWFCPEIQRAIEERNFWHGRLRDFPDNDFLRDRYKDLRNSVTNLIRFHKKRHYTSLIDTYVSNSKKLWQVFNELIYNRSRSGVRVVSKVFDALNNIVTDERGISEAFNTYFVNVASSLRSALVLANFNRPVISTMRYWCASSMFVSNTDEHEVLHVIRSLNNGSSSGYDEIPVGLIKNCSSTILSSLVATFNVSLRSCEFPNCLKISRTVPIYKSGEKSNVSNYRPISVLTNFSKIFEKLIYKRLESFYVATKFFHSNQFGFVPKSNTCAAVLNFITFIRHSLNSKKFTSAIFIDMSKAFDCVVHDILLEKLYKSGVRGDFHALLASYLSGRSQMVQIGGSLSSAQEVRLSVPQGSILGPLLFLVYINDIFELKLRGTLQLYADDIIIMYSSDNIVDLYDDMQHDLDIMREWFYNNYLTVNSGKTSFMMFKDPRRVISYSRPLLFGGSMINQVFEQKYLGMIFDSSLNFHAHINQLRKKIVSFVGVLGRVRHYIPITSRLKIYFAHIHSHISYLNVIWSAAPAYKLMQIRRLQNKAIRLVFFEEYRRPGIHTVDLFKNHTLLNLSQINAYEIILLIYKLKNNLMKHNLNLTTNDEIHEHNTRRRFDFHTGLNVANDYGRLSVMHQGLNLFNALPIALKTENNFEKFKKKLKLHVMNIY
jgi:Reverse transcriptase (RNA-dependent DNA polymerase)